MSNPKEFIAMLSGYKAENLPKWTKDQVKKYQELEYFNYHAMKRISMAAANLVRWVNAVMAHDKVLSECMKLQSITAEEARKMIMQEEELRDMRLNGLPEPEQKPKTEVTTSVQSATASKKVAQDAVLSALSQKPATVQSDA